jgi:hypothetical protein
MCFEGDTGRNPSPSAPSPALPDVVPLNLGRFAPFNILDEFEKRAIGKPHELVAFLGLAIRCVESLVRACNHFEWIFETEYKRPIVCDLLECPRKRKSISLRSLRG